MTSSGKPSFSSIMEEKHFGCMGNTTNTKIVSNDFINREKCSNDFSECPLLGELITDCEVNTEKSIENNENKQYNKKISTSPDRESLSVHNNHNSESVDSDFESKNEDNDSDDNTSLETSIPKLPNTNIDDNLPSTVTLLRTPDGGKCYIVGTAHFSLESQNDVSKIIQAVKPHVVMVELCVDRIHVLELDEETILQEAQNLNFNKIMYTIKQNGMYKGLFYLLLLNMSAHFTKVLGLAPGGEFRRALIEAKKLPNCIIHMGDRPIKITFARALSFLTWWQKIKLAWQLLTEKEMISQKDVERYKCRDSVEEIMTELATEYPALGEVFVKERDVYLTHSLQLVCKPKIGKYGEHIPARVVGVVGIGHTIGIVNNWGKVTGADIPPIMSIPPPSFSSKVLKYTIKATVVGSIIYVGYKFIPIPIGLIMSLKSSVQYFIKINPS